MPARDRMFEYLCMWATNRVPMDKSRMRLEEVFLWGCQTGQRMSGIEPRSPEFIIDAGLALTRRGKVLGWHLNMKDGGVEFLRYKGDEEDKIELVPVIKSRKRRKIITPKAATPKSTVQVQPDNKVLSKPVPQATASESSEDIPANAEQFATLMSRAGKIVRDVLPKAGLKESNCGPMVGNWLLKQSGKPKVNKISAAKFDELLSRLEAVASDPEAVVKILSA